MRVLTPTGYRDVTEMSVGDPVCAFNEVTGAPETNYVEQIEDITPDTFGRWDEEADGTHTRFVPDQFEHYLINGRFLLCKYQSIWANEQGITHADQLRVGDTIYDDRDQPLRVHSVKRRLGEKLWIRLRISGDHSFIADGLSLHNASRFWVGGGSSANWSAVTNTNWGSVTNTRNNSSVPGSADDVFFDGAANGAVNSTCSANITIKSMDFTGWANTLTHSSAVVITIAGVSAVCKYSTGMGLTISAGSSTVTFTATSGTAVLTSNGKSGPAITMNGAGGTLQFADNYTTSQNASLLTLTAGTIDLNGKAFTIGQLSSSNSNARTIKSTVAGTVLTVVRGTAGASVVDFATSTNAVIDQSIPWTIALGMNSTNASTFAGGGLTFGVVTWTNPQAQILTVTGSSTFGSFAFSGGVASTLSLTVGTTQTITKANGFVSGAAAGTHLIVQASSGSATVSSPQVQQCNFLTLTGVVATQATTFYAASSTDSGGNTNWVFGTAPIVNREVFNQQAVNRANSY